MIEENKNIDSDLKTTKLISGAEDDSLWRENIIKRIHLIGTILAIITTTQYFFIFREFQEWQILARIFGVIFAWGLLMLGRLSLKRGNSLRAENMMPIAVFVLYTSGELFWSGATIYDIIGGVLLIQMIALFIKPRNNSLWLLITVMLIATVLLLEQIQPFPRFDINRSSRLQIAVPGLTAALALALFFLFIFSIQGKSLRLRLLVSFILFALIPTTVTVAISSTSGNQLRRDEIIEYLDSVATTKELQIQSWIYSLEVNLSNVIREKEPVIEILSSAAIDPSNPTVVNDLAFAIQETNSFSNLYIINNISGLVEESTDNTLIGANLTSEEYFQKGQTGFFVSSLSYNTDRNALNLMIAGPIKDDGGITIGILAGEVNLEGLKEITQDYSKLGETGESYLISEDSLLLSETRNGTGFIPGITHIQSTWLESAIESETVASGLYSNYLDEDALISFHWISILKVGLIVEQYQSEAFQFSQNNLIITLGVSIMALLIAIFFSFIMSKNISQPIITLARSAAMFSSGEADKFEPVNRGDEIGDLSNALSKMTSQLQSSLSQMEETIEQRTEVLERRTLHLEAIAEIGRAATEIYALEELLTTITHLISEKFNFYHVGIFILDERGEFAVLKAANSEGGWQMLARGHKLRVGEQGIVGFVTESMKPRIQQSIVGDDSVHYDNPDLPLTKSEMALPLSAGGELFGVLDVQSTLEQAFSEEDISILQSLADEVAITINNTRLFEQLQESLETERRIYGELSSEAWLEIQHQSKHDLNIRSDESGVYQVSDSLTPESKQAVQSQKTILADPSPGNQRYPISIPVKARGNVVVAVLETYKPTTSGQWTSQEIAILEAIAEQLGIALENARLFDETQRLAQREKIAAEVAGKIWASTDVETILQTAVQELGRALNVSQGTIRLRIPEDGGSDEISPDDFGVEEA